MLVQKMYVFIYFFIFLYFILFFRFCYSNSCCSKIFTIEKNKQLLLHDLRKMGLNVSEPAELPFGVTQAENIWRLKFVIYE